MPAWKSNVGAMALLASIAFGASGKLELRGRVTDSAVRFRALRVTLFRIESPFTEWTLTDPAGEFRFHNLDPGNYTVSIMRRGLGEIRRSVVVTPALADKKGIVRVRIPFSPADAALSRSGSLVSKQQLAVPDKARAKYIEAERKLAKHDTAGAIGNLEEAIRIAPRYMAAWNYLGVLAFQARDLNQAEQYFRKAREIEPAGFEPTVNLGGLLLALGRPQEALALNLKALETRPRDPLANSQTGRAYFFLGQLEEAEQYLTKAKTLDPAHYSQPQLYLAEIYRRRGDREGAARELEDLLARRPDGPQAENIRRRLSRLQ
jgi:tetratricopeptide (TPR) repeat protein